MLDNQDSSLFLLYSGAGEQNISIRRLEITDN